MEGIIPMVYKTLKRSNTRRQYQSLSSSAAAVSGDRQSYDINNFYSNNNHHHLHYATPPRINGGDRRHKSFDSSGAGAEDYSVKSKQLMRLRSHRMFSCITGA